jgi:multidrug efflux pump subunit AcrB
MTLNLSLWAVRNRAVTLFLILVAVAAGTQAYLTLGRAEDPTFTIKTMVIQVVWPGATSQEVQDLVADPMERSLQDLPELDWVRTFSRPGAAVIQVQLLDAVRGDDVAEAWYQVRKKVGDLRPEFPKGVIGPFFNDEFGDVFSAIFMLTGDGLSRAELADYAEDLRARLLEVDGASKVALVGEVEDQVTVEVSHRRLATLGLPPSAIFEAIARQNAVAPAGSLETAADAVQVRVTGELAGEEALRDVPLALSQGGTMRLGDVATVTRGPLDPPSFLAFLNGQPAIGVGVVMAPGENVLRLGEGLEAAAEEFRATLPLGVELTQTADQAYIVDEAFKEFVKAFGEALIIVLAVSFLSLGLRTGIVVALSVPIVLAIVFVVMKVMGLDFDRISLGALIIALGLLVDDAIIAVETMVVRLEEGATRLAAAGAAWDSTAFPMLTGTLVTAAGFLPVGFARSTAGEYAGNIFWVVGIALLASWLVAVVVTPYLGVLLLREPAADARRPHGGGAHEGRSYRALRHIVQASLRRRWLVLGLTGAALVLAGLGMTRVPQQFFPASARSELFIETRLPAGSSITASQETALAAAALVEGDPDVRFVTTWVGAGTPRFFFALNPALPDPAYAVSLVVATDATARDRVRARIEAAVAAGAVPQARVRVDQIVFGPPVGFPVQVRVVGDSSAAVREAATAVRDVMAQDPDIVEPQFDWGERAKTVTVSLDQDRVRALGLSTLEVSQVLQTLLSGLRVSELRDGDDLVDVVVRAPRGEREDPSTLGSLTLLLPGGQSVPLSQVATVSTAFEEPILWRRNRDLTLTVRADVRPGVQPPTVSARLEAALAPLRETLPVGVRLETGGAVEESAKANASLFAVFPAMILVMLALLMVQLRSFSKLALVLLTAPLGAIGAVAALLLAGAPFGFVALLGVIALAGMIMRNSVILVDQIDHDLESGREPWDAIVESTVRRARPVVLTALAAILAMTPLTGSVFWGPMALAIMGGLVVATVLTLVALPAMYAAWFRVRQLEGPAIRPSEQQLDQLAQVRLAAE